MRAPPPFPRRVTANEKYGPALSITDQAEADAYLERCVEHAMTDGANRETAERIERSNLGYWAGYCDAETRARVERLFRCKHPVFGAIAEKGPPTAEQALLAGKNFAKGRS